MRFLLRKVNSFEKINIRQQWQRSLGYLNIFLSFVSYWNAIGINQRCPTGFFKESQQWLWTCAKSHIEQWKTKIILRKPLDFVFFSRYIVFCIGIGKYFQISLKQKCNNFELTSSLSNRLYNCYFGHWSLLRTYFRSHSE